ncbi:MAG: hypothetical protein DMG38_01895 [Acidobacteria bacterium]|nr:MAG: hypothetical protein DMG38_01895 [Acidobacteriota bacterium]
MISRSRAKGGISRSARMALITSGRGEGRSALSLAAFVLAVCFVSSGAGDRKAAATVTGFRLGGRSVDGAPESFQGDAGDWGAGGRLGSSSLGVRLGAGGFVLGSYE